jgi:hypothetical protein
MNTSFQTASEQSPGRFGNAQRLLGHLDANVISNLITTTADVVLVMDENGLIEDAAFANEELLNGRIGLASLGGKQSLRKVETKSTPCSETLPTTKAPSGGN